MTREQQPDLERLVAGGQQEELKVCAPTLLMQSIKRGLSSLSPKLHKHKSRLFHSFGSQQHVLPSNLVSQGSSSGLAKRAEERSPFPSWLPPSLISPRVLPSRTSMWTGIWKACKSFISALFCSVLSMLGV